MLDKYGEKYIKRLESAIFDGNQSQRGQQIFGIDVYVTLYNVSLLNCIISFVFIKRLQNLPKSVMVTLTFRWHTEMKVSVSPHVTEKPKCYMGKPIFQPVHLLQMWAEV